MKVGRLAHAGLLVEAGTSGVLVDPVLASPFENGTLEFWPPTRIDAAALAHRYAAIVVSHEHMDHFCVRSLAQLDRSALVLYPKGCELIPLALRALGFGRALAVGVGETHRVGELAMTFTPSAVRFPEVGILFDYNGMRFWNAVDSEIDDRAVNIARAGRQRPDVMFAAYQPLVEESLGVDGLGCPFPLTIYQRLVHAAASAAPRCVVPASCGYRYRLAGWFDSRAFPVSEDEFLRDVRAVDPTIIGRVVPHGAAIDVGDLSVTDGAVLGVERTPMPQPDWTLAWRPDQGVEPLHDDDPYDHGTEWLRTCTATVLDRLRRDVASAVSTEWRRRLAAASVVWELQVVYPDGSLQAQCLDLSLGQPEWTCRADHPAKVRTVIAASTLIGLTNGEVSTYRALHTRRVVLRMYRADRRGVVMAGKLNDEPIARLLFPGAERRFVEGELRRLAVSGLNATQTGQ